MFISFVICIILFNPGTDSKFVSPPDYTLNLSLPATEIWAEVARDYAHKFPKLFEEIESKLPQELLDEVASITPHIHKYLYPPFVDEMKGIAKYGNVSMERIVLLNLLYDIHAYDHSEEMSSVSVVFNSDYDPNNPIVTGGIFGWVYTPLLRDMIIVVGTPIPAQYIIRGATFAGMVGLQAGVVAADFSAMYTERKADSNKTWRVIFDNLRTGNYTTLPLQIRYKLQYDPLGYDFLDQLIDFSDSRLLSPSYLMLAGVDSGEGALITRDCNAAYDTITLNSHWASWFVIGTNTPPWAIFPPDSHKEFVSIELMKSGTDTDIAGLLRILQYPRLYDNHTAFVTATTPCYWGPYTTLIYYPD